MALSQFIILKVQLSWFQTVNPKPISPLIVDINSEVNLLFTPFSKRYKLFQEFLSCTSWETEKACRRDAVLKSRRHDNTTTTSEDMRGLEKHQHRAYFPNLICENNAQTTL